MGKTKIRWFGMKLTPEEKQKIKRLAEIQGTSAKQVILRLVDEALDTVGPEQRIEARPGSFLDRFGHLAGCIEGPVDLSTNPKHMERFGRS